MRRREVPPIRMFKFVAPGYMKTLGGSIVAGRDFTWDDAHGRRPVAMVSASLARELWGGPAQAIGKRMRPYAKGVWREVVGVVSDTRDEGVTKKAATVAYWPISMAEFLPERRQSRCSCSATRPIWCGAAGPAADGFVRDLERAVWSVNPNLPLAAVRTLEEIYEASLARTSFTLVMLAIAGDDGAAPRRRRHLRRDLVRGVAAAARDRHPHRARGDAARGDAACSSGTACCSPASASAIGLATALADHAADGDAAVRGQPGRPADLRPGVADALRRDRARLLPAGPARDRASIRSARSGPSRTASQRAKQGSGVSKRGRAGGPELVAR